MSAMSPEDLSRITDYMSGELSSDERAEIERWIDEDAARTALVQQLRRSQDTIKHAYDSSLDLAGIGQRIRARVAVSGSDVTTTRQQAKVPVPISRTVIKGSESARWRLLGVSLTL